MINIERIPYEGPAFDKEVINDASELMAKLQAFCQQLADKLPKQYTVNLHRSGFRSFTCSIVFMDGNPVQQFAIDWDKYNQVNWRPYVG